MVQRSEATVSGAHHTPGDGDPCTACGGCVGRRDFFRLGLGAAALTLVASLLPSSASAAVGWTLGTRRDGLLRYPVPPSDSVEIDRGSEVIIVRTRDMAMAFALSCPHQRSMLRWRDEDGKFQCTKHRSEYTPEGTYMKGRATRNMDRLAISLEGAELVVDPSTVFHSDDDPQEWEAAAVALT